MRDSNIMSEMSYFEKTVRNTVAVSILNKTRHWMQGRPKSELSIEEKSVLKEALDILDKKQFNKMIVHSFRGIDDGLNSSVLSISDSFESTQYKNKDTIKNHLQASLESQFQLDQSQKDEIIDFLGKAIQSISDVTTSYESNPIMMSEYSLP